MAFAKEIKMVDKEAQSRIGKSNVNRSKTHERQVAKELSEWSSVTFRRRRAEGRGPAVVDLEGAADVIAIGYDFCFSVEAKCGKGFSLDAMLKNIATAKFTSWWHQATYDANLMTESRGRKIYPLLFFRPFLNTNWIAFPFEAIQLLVPKNESAGLQPQQLWFPHLIFNGYNAAGEIANDVSHSHKNKNIVNLQLSEPVLCRWQDFRDNIDPKSTFVTYPE